MGNYRKLLVIPLISVFWQMQTARLAAQDRQLGSQDTGVKLLWRSETKNDEQVPVALEKLIVTLYNIRDLPTKTVVDEEGATIEQILRRHNQFYGAFFPQGVENVLCDLNPASCSRLLTDEQNEKLLNVTQHVGGFLKSQPKWTNKRGSRLTIPNFAFSSYTTLVPFLITDKISPEHLIKQEVDCSKWQLSCRELLLRLNPQYYLAQPKGPAPIQVIIPVAGVKTPIVLSLRGGSRLQEPLNKLGNDILVEKTIPPTTLLSRSWNRQIQRIDLLHIGVEALSRNIAAAGDAKVQSSPDAMPFLNEQQRSLFKVLRHPFHAIKAEEVKSEWKNPVVIGIVDTWLDASHCNLGSNIAIEAPTNGMNATQAAQCGEIKLAPKPPDDHGTHIVGLIAAKPGKNGITGLNPFAHVKYRGLLETSLRGASYREEIAQRFLTWTILEDVKVVNISWRYANEVGGSDRIAHIIGATKQTALYVVAAGNDLTNFDGSVCGERPACLKGDNVIVVVGLDSNSDAPGLWRNSSGGSNSSKDFHIAAIAEDVLSTVSGGFLGRMSGTSQAAPQVTAAASLLHSIHLAHWQADEPVLLPVRVRNRLIYTADIFSSLLHVVKSGRLNIERAIDVAHAFFVVADETGARTYRGNLAKFGNNQAEEIVCRTVAQEDFRIARKDLRRMFFNGATQRYVIFRNSQSGNRNSAVERITDCNLRTLSHKAEVITDQGTTVQFEFRQIRDYISPMFE